MSDASDILREPWPSVPRQREGVSFGMWTFLASEVLFFGTLLVSYAVYRTLYPQAFAAASHETNILYGSINTALLLTSSFVMTVALRASQARMRRLLIFCLLLTAAFGIAFEVVKGLEYADDLRKNLLPGPDFKLGQAPARLFFGLYWILTGVHAVHLAVGIALVGLLAVAVLLGRIAAESPAVEAIGLYWHFVDTIWIILFALIYLPGRP